MSAIEREPRDPNPTTRELADKANEILEAAYNQETEHWGEIRGRLARIRELQQMEVDAEAALAKIGAVHDPTVEMAKEKAEVTRQRTPDDESIWTEEGNGLLVIPPPEPLALEEGEQE